MAPPGTKIVVYEDASSHGSFAQHGKVGWYIGPSLEHYRCWRCYFPDTMKERDDVLKVDFVPEKAPFPAFWEVYLHQTAKDMLHSLSLTDSSPLLAPPSFGLPILNTFAKVATILPRGTS